MHAFVSFQASSFKLGLEGPDWQVWEAPVAHAPHHRGQTCDKATMVMQLHSRLNDTAPTSMNSPVMMNTADESDSRQLRSPGIRVQLPRPCLLAMASIGAMLMTQGLEW